MAADLPTPIATERAPARAVAAHGQTHKSSYGEILKWSTLIGGSTVLTLAVGIVRTKAMAVLLGPAGFGLMGVFTSIADLARTAAEMGINSSGVRQIAEAVGSGDHDRIARTVVVLRRVAIVLGLIGALMLVLFARSISSLTFGTDEHADAVALLSVAVFLRLVTDGQGALMQGMRRIGDMAKTGVLGALLGTMLSIPIVYALGRDGVVPALVAVAAASCLVSWFYIRRIPVPAQLPILNSAEFRKEVSSLLGLGLAFMASGFLMMGAAYAVRLMLIRHEGLEAAGLYQAAWTIGGMYVGFVLQAMGADFYPRLVAASKDNAQCNRLVNEQAQVSLLLGGCGVLATLTFAPWIVTLLYSSDFEAGTDVLRWVTLGMAMRVITWPVGYILVAKGERTLFVAADLAWAIVNIGLTWLCVQPIRPGWCRHRLPRLLCGPSAGRLLDRAAPRRLPLVDHQPAHGSALRLGHRRRVRGLSLLSPPAAMALGAVATVASALYSVHVLRMLVAPEHVPKRLSWILRTKKDGL